MHLPYVDIASLDNLNFLVKLELLLDEECWWSKANQSLLCHKQALLLKFLATLIFLMFKLYCKLS